MYRSVRNSSDGPFFVLHDDAYWNWFDLQNFLPATIKRESLNLLWEFSDSVLKETGSVFFLCSISPLVGDGNRLFHRDCRLARWKFQKIQFNALTKKSHVQVMTYRSWIMILWNWPNHALIALRAWLHSWSITRKSCLINNVSMILSIVLIKEHL